MCLAIPGKVVSVTGAGAGQGETERTARVDFGGIIKEVNLACLPETVVGDYVVVHVGVAISKVDPKEAQRIFDYLRQMSETNTEPQR